MDALTLVFMGIVLASSGTVGLFWPSGPRKPRGFFLFLIFDGLIVLVSGISSL